MQIFAFSPLLGRNPFYCLYWHWIEIIIKAPATQPKFIQKITVSVDSMSNTLAFQQNLNNNIYSCAKYFEDGQDK